MKRKKNKKQKKKKKMMMMMMKVLKKETDEGVNAIGKRRLKVTESFILIRWIDGCILFIDPSVVFN